MYKCKCTLSCAEHRKMPSCCVEWCTNRSKKGFRLFPVPTGDKNKERRLEWLKLIGRNTLSDRAYVCQVQLMNYNYV